jgi:hypothetical protein
MSIIKKVWNATPASRLVKGDIKGALKKGIDPLGIVLKNKKKKAVTDKKKKNTVVGAGGQAVTKRMAKGGKTNCRGMGAATRGGKYHP